VEEGDLEAIAAPEVLPKPRDVAAAVDRLLPAECCALTAACCERFLLKPRERNACGSWLTQVLDRRGESLVRGPELRNALKQLGRGSVRGHRPCSSARVQEALARWTLIAELSGRRAAEDDAAAAQEGSVAEEGGAECSPLAEEQAESDADPHQ